VTVVAGQFGERRDARQTLLRALDEASELETVVLVKVYRDRTVNVSWSDADKLTLMGALALGQAQVREWQP